MQPVSINDYFNSNNPWALRLLGITDFKKKRDLSQIENEYNLDKYARLLEFNFDSMEEYKAKEFEQAGLHPIKGEMFISTGDDIYKVTVAEARKKYYELITNTVEKYMSEHICELGCGYGYNLSLFKKNTYGGEYAQNAVKLAQKLGMEVCRFNYYKEEDYNFIKPGSTIFTAHSIEQIPDASVIIDSLSKQKDKIRYVVHFEPTVLKERTTLFGLMRNKYMELNDYNRNLTEILKSRNDIEILELKTDVFGLVPLNTTNLIAWRFKT